MITPGELGDVGGAAATCLDGCESNRFMLQCMSLLLALSGHLSCAHRCPLSEVKRTLVLGLRMSVPDPDVTCPLAQRFDLDQGGSYLDSAFIWA